MIEITQKEYDYFMKLKARADSLYYHKKKYSVEQIDNILEPKNLIKRYIMA